MVTKVMPTTQRLDAARGYLRRGWQPISVPEGTKGPRTPGWQSQRYTEADLPGAFAGSGNIGILLGEPSGGLVDVDLDCEEAVELAEQYLPPTPVRTGHGARPRSHWWYRVPGIQTKRYSDPRTKEVVLELRSTGAQTLVGPSVHPETGEVYDALEGEPASVTAEELIAGITNLYDAVMEQRYGPSGPVQPHPFPARQPDPRRGDDDVRVLRRAEAYLDKMPGAISGQGGHNATYAAATALVHGFRLTEATALGLLEERYNPRCQPPWTRRELEHKVREAATKGHDRPYGWLRDAARDHDGGPTFGPVAEGTPRGGAAPPEATEATRGPLGRRRTDLGNAERFAAMWKDHLRYCHATGKWLVWDGQRWTEDMDGTPLRLAGETARSILREALNEEDPEVRAALAKWAAASESKGKHEATVKLATAQPALVVRVADLDADPFLLNVINGTIDLRTGELRPHRREDNITKLAPVRYDPDAVCPRFEAFLDRVFAGNGALARYVQKLLGMSLTGDITEHVMPIFYGAGANGKSVMLDTVMGIMGGYATEAAPQLLIETRGSREHPTEVADLMGRRLVVASETEQGGQFKLALVKRLTGDATLKGRFMKQDYFSFGRTHKLLMVTNNKPRVKEDSEAVWRRLRLIPFTVVIPPEERDPKLMEKLREEWSGILAWMVRGCLAWRAEGLEAPAAVLVATAEYREAEDQIGRFLEECCVVDDSGAGEASELFTPWSVLVKEYEDWAEASGEVAMKGRRLGEALDKRGLVGVQRRHAGKSCKGRAGVSLRSEARPYIEEEAA